MEILRGSSILVHYWLSVSSVDDFRDSITFSVEIFLYVASAVPECIKVIAYVFSLNFGRIWQDFGGLLWKLLRIRSCGCSGLVEFY